MTSKLIEVAPCIPLPRLSPQSYTYALPADADEAELFSAVTIPFGPRTVPGVIVSRVTKPVKYKTKTVVRAYSWQLTAHQVALADWIHRTMQGGLGYTLRLFFPTLTQPLTRDAVTKIPRVSTARRVLPPVRRIVVEKDLNTRVKALQKLARAQQKKHAQLLVLVPEKWMVERLLTLLAKNTWTIAAVHSDVTAREYATIWQAVRSGKINMVIGTQKALFLPYLKLGALVVEEEFAPAHKLWDQYPRLDNKIAAREYALITGSELYYFSSVLSPQLLYLQEQEKLTIAEKFVALPGSPLEPKMEIFGSTFADQRAHHILPTTFLQALTKWLRHGEQVVLLHNVRGNWQVLGCTACQAVIRCKECGVAMVTHGSGASRTLTCHHCSRHEAFPETCPTCKKKKLRPFGLGAERLTEIIQQNIPSSVALLHVDVTLLRQAPVRRKVLRAQLIITTSAIFAHVPTLTPDRAVYVFPERGLLYPDYRSAERTYTTLVRLQQLLGVKKKVSVVTRRSRLVQETLGLSPLEFCRAQLKERKRHSYPPYTDAVLLTVRSTKTSSLQEKSEALRGALDTRVATLGGTPVQLRGPFTGFIKKKKGKFEAHILLLGDLAVLQKLYDGLVFDEVDVAPERIL